VALPAGEDPDSLVKKGGPGAFQALLDSAKPLSGVLFDMLAARHPGATPEARAALKHALEDASAQIADKALGAEYRRLLIDRFYESGRRPREQRAFVPNQGGAWKKGGRAGPPALNLPAPGIDNTQAARERARCLLAITLGHPWLLPEVEEALHQLELPPDSEEAALCAGILGWFSQSETLEAAALQAYLADTAPGPLGWALAPGGAGTRLGAPDAQPAEVSRAWWHFFGFLRGEDALREDFEAAQRDWIAANDAPSQNRMLRLMEALMAQRRGDMDDDDAEPAGAL